MGTKTRGTRRVERDLNELVKARIEVLVSQRYGETEEKGQPELWTAESFKEEFQEEMESTWREESRNGFD